LAQLDTTRIFGTAVIQHINSSFTRNCFDEKIMSNFKVGIIVIPIEALREHNLEITSTIEQGMQL